MNEIKTLEIGNNGTEIVSTNYFNTWLAEKGLMFLSCNAGTFRLLMPDQHLHILNDLNKAGSVIITIGVHNNIDVIEILFDDGSNKPIALHISSEQCDRDFHKNIENKKEAGNDFEFTLWSRTRKEFSLPCRYRYKEEIPYLKKWGE